MNRIALALVAACAACSGFADGYADWYTPATPFDEQVKGIGFTVGGVVGSIGVNLDDKTPRIANKLDAAIQKMLDDGDIDENAKGAFKVAKTALTEAIFAQLQAEKNKQKIDSLGASVETIFQLTNAEKVDASGRIVSRGQLAQGVRGKLLDKKNALIGGTPAGGAEGEGGDDKPLQIRVTEFNYDTLEFEQREQGEKMSKMALKGYKDLEAATRADASDQSKSLAWHYCWIPCTAGKDDNIVWGAWGGIDNRSLDVAGAESGDYQGGITIRGFNNGDRGGCNDTVAGLLTDTDRQSANKHMILARYADGESTELHWVTIGDRLSVGDGIPPDNETIDVVVNDNNETNLQVYAWQEAKEAAAEDERGAPYIPYADGLDTLGWASLFDFFSDKVFDTTSDGRLILNGVSEEGSDKVRVLAVSGSGDSQEVGTVSFDNASVDGNIETAQVIQMHNFSVAPSPYGAYSTLTFADSLTNASANISGMSIPVRYPNGNRAEIAYIPMGKITGIPSASCDNKTIEASKDKDAADDAPDKLRIVGSKDATKGQLLKMGDDGAVEWGDFPMEVDRPEGLEEDEYPLYITEADPENDEPAKIGINGWETTDSPEGLYGAGDGKPVTYRFAEIKTLEADAENRTVELKGYADAGNYSMAFKESENGLGWVAPPSSGSAILMMNAGADPSATVLGASVEQETVSGKTTLNIKRFTSGGGCDTTMSDMLTKDVQSANRAHHQVLTRYSTGSGTPSVHWVPMGDRLDGGGSPVDNASITTNTANGAVTQGVASLYGFSTASAGDVPHKKSDGKIEWKPVAAGGALLVQGNYDSTVATCTNKLIFASESDSNVKFRVTQGQNGNVTVTVGVYYK